MATKDMARVYRLLRIAREEGIIPWEFIVDEAREIERVATWDDPADYARCVAQSYRRDFWNQQPHRVQVWSEKGTVRGVVAPVLEDPGHTKEQQPYFFVQLANLTQSTILSSRTPKQHCGSTLA